MKKIKIVLALALLLPILSGCGESHVETCKERYQGKMEGKMNKQEVDEFCSCASNVLDNLSSDYDILDKKKVFLMHDAYYLNSMVILKAKSSDGEEKMLGINKIRRELEGFSGSIDKTDMQLYGLASGKMLKKCPINKYWEKK